MGSASVCSGDIVLVLPELCLLFILIILLLIGLFVNEHVIFSVVVYSFGYVLYLILLRGDLDFQIFNNTFGGNSFVFLIEVALLICVFVVIVFFKSYLKYEGVYHYEYLLLISFGVLGMCLMLLSRDLMSLYLSMELQSLCLYVLGGIKKYSNYSMEASIKYFIFSAYASGFFLYGVMLCYGSAGTLNYLDLESFIQLSLSGGSIYMGFVYVIVGLLFKLGAAPFHMWLPDVYEGLPTNITFIYATLPKITVVGVLINLVTGVGCSVSYVVNSYIGIIGMLTILVGTFGSIGQRKIKRLLGFSGISHVGYILVGISIGTIEGLVSVVFYLMVYILMAINLFMIILSVRSVVTNRLQKGIKSLGIIGGTTRGLSGIFILLCLSLSGVPPLGGFYSKWILIMSLLKSKAYIIVLEVLVFSVISCYYYLRLLRMSYFGYNKTKESLIEPIGTVEGYIISYISVVVASFMLYSEIALLVIWGAVSGTC